MQNRQHAPSARAWRTASWKRANSEWFVCGTHRFPFSYLCSSHWFLSISLTLWSRHHHRSCPAAVNIAQPRLISPISLMVSPSPVTTNLTPRPPSISPSSLSSLFAFHSTSHWLWVFFFFWVDLILVSNCGGWFAVEVGCSGGDGGFWYDGWVVGDGGLWGWYGFCVFFF